MRAYIILPKAIPFHTCPALSCPSFHEKKKYSVTLASQVTMIIHELITFFDKIPWILGVRNMVSVSVSYCYVTSKHKKKSQWHTIIRIYLAHASAGQLHASIDLRWTVCTSWVGWRLTDLSGAWLSGLLWLQWLGSMSHCKSRGLGQCISSFLNQHATQGMSLSWQWQRYKREGPTAKSQLCFTSAKIPLAKANFIVDPEVKGWENTLIHAYTGNCKITWERVWI